MQTAREKLAIDGRFAVAILLLLVGGGAAHAQVAIPSGLEPGQLQRQLEQLRAPPATRTTKRPPVPQQVPPADAVQTTFTWQGAQLDGVAAYPLAALLQGLEPAPGATVSVAQVFELANRLTARYRNDGYLLSQVLVPAQTIGGGRVRLVAVEGYVAEVEYRGIARDARLDAIAATLVAERPLTSDTLERELLLLNDAGLGTARGTLVASATVPGAATLVVDVGTRRWAASAGYTNRGSRSLGPSRLDLALDLAPGLLAWDRAALRFGSSLDRELNYVGASYGASFGDGWSWNAGATAVRSRAGRAANFTDPDLKTDSLAGSVYLNRAWIRTRSVNVALRGGITSFDGQSEFTLATVSDDRIRALRAGVYADAADSASGISTLDLEYSHGLRGLGAKRVGTGDSPLSRAQGRADFSKLTLYVARLQDIAGPWSVLFAVQAQHAFDTLLAPEAFAFGGEPFGRGYDAAELLGDSGEASKAELRYGGVLGARAAYTAYAFHDWGRVRRRAPVNEPARESAKSWGLGLRVSDASGHWQGFVEFADPIDRAVAAEGNRDPRVYAGLQFSL